MSTCVVSRPWSVLQRPCKPPQEWSIFQQLWKVHRSMSKSSHAMVRKLATRLSFSKTSLKRSFITGNFWSRIKHQFHQTQPISPKSTRCLCLFNLLPGYYFGRQLAAQNGTLHAAQELPFRLLKFSKTIRCWKVRTCCFLLTITDNHC